ncbi:hypothetical protein ACHAPT_008255 [Fusarium lateritium]
MESLPRPFTITVDGKNVAPPVDDGEDRIHAETGPEAAVFTLKNCRLESEGWSLGRFQIEDMSLLPKRVYWFKPGIPGQDDAIQPVFAEKNGDSFVLKFGGQPLVAMSDRLFAPLLDQPQQTVEINLQ